MLKIFCLDLFCLCGGKGSLSRPWDFSTLSQWFCRSKVTLVWHCPFRVKILKIMSAVLIHIYREFLGESKTCHLKNWMGKSCWRGLSKPNQSCFLAFTGPYLSCNNRRKVFLQMVPSSRSYLSLAAVLTKNHMAYFGNLSAEKKRTKRRLIQCHNIVYHSDN